MRLRSCSIVGAVIASLSATAYAHFGITTPPSSLSADKSGKGAPPCGPDAPSAVITKVQGGHTIPLKLVETVMHPGHYRLALSINSRNELPPDPMVVVKNGQSVSAAIDAQPKMPVLADGVFVHTTGSAPINFQMDLMLPNVNCAKCTLQVIEFMAEHGPNPGGGYFYHHCADLEITADPTMPIAGGAPAPDGGAPDSSPGGQGGQGGTGGSGGTAGATGGTGGTAGTSATGGSGGIGGSGGTGGTAGAGGIGGVAGSGATGGTTGKSSGGSAGGCALGGSTAAPDAALVTGVIALLIARRRRTKSSS